MADDPHIALRLRVGARALVEGARLSQALRATELCPPEVSQHIGVAEEYQSTEEALAWLCPECDRRAAEASLAATQ